ncbi:MAG TPA: twin-arginine translocase TatA/TatE family subunit [Gammaproteobacteria bacterium]|nr:twin-arginine translocase TatA/TatE family subunit [Gammaproteobacteria bacterium]
MELSVGKILLILVIVVLVFGTARLPKIGEDIGRAVRSFKKGMHVGEDETGASAKPADDKPQSGTGNSSH